MIIYGTNGSHVRTEPRPGLACPACTTPDALHLSVFSRYAHIYWIPVVPYTKPAVAQCLHCQSAWALAELPAEAGEVKQALRTFRKETRAPWWQWSGLAALVVLAVWGFIMSQQNTRDNAAYIAAPRVGDIYTVRANDSTGKAQYSLLKVVSAQGNTVELVGNDYVSDNAEPLGLLNDPEKYSKQTFPLTFLDLQVMMNKGEITDVDRLEE
ncbi:hypothetical protein [Hymenobacter cellulosilyticus]|uniref:Zinc-ribbon domain-containing protein n=1 Tax=Hymenobacter cellulosilyticus TaxID=2932248 RepID=A0A8T9Q6K9_9BACT|nr:hypothetical protein [Hymenobacter cellulosilyticus]UOQ71410.1 hypothetical protein MUN79_22735 [Hymenobacter cellulosilyticus]